jgi:hypothetical protein
MCQAYEGERRAIVAGENIASVKGFAAAHANKPKSANPHKSPFCKYQHDAWNHGWESYKEGHFPWGLEKLYRKKVSLETVYRVTERFREKRSLTPAILQILVQYT